MPLEFINLDFKKENHNRVYTVDFMGRSNKYGFYSDNDIYL